MEELTVWKLVAAAMTALFITASTHAHAQTPSAGEPEQLSPADWGTLTDARINVVKAALQLTPDQEKYWPAVESAIRLRAQHRQARLANEARRVADLRNGNLIRVLREGDPVDFLHRRADALTERAADVKKLADAWQPLYQTLKQDQKRRMAFLTIFVLGQMGNAVQRRMLQTQDDAED